MGIDLRLTALQLDVYTIVQSLSPPVSVINHNFKTELVQFSQSFVSKLTNDPFLKFLIDLALLQDGHSRIQSPNAYG